MQGLWTNISTNMVTGKHPKRFQRCLEKKKEYEH